MPEPGHICDRLVAVPFHQVSERGFEAHDDGTPLVVVDVTSEHEFSVADVIDAIDEVPVEFTDRGGFETDDEEYARVERRGDRRLGQQGTARVGRLEGGGRVQQLVRRAQAHGQLADQLLPADLVAGRGDPAEQLHERINRIREWAVRKTS